VRLSPAGRPTPDQGLSRRVAEPSDPQLHRVTRSGQADRESCGRPAQAAHAGTRRQAGTSWPPKQHARARWSVNPALKVRDGMRGLPVPVLAPSVPWCSAECRLAKRVVRAGFGMTRRPS
jgi:hypothetical protein